MGKASRARWAKLTCRRVPHFSTKLRVADQASHPMNIRLGQPSFLVNTVQQLEFSVFRPLNV